MATCKNCHCKCHCDGDLHNHHYDGEPCTCDKCTCGEAKARSRMIKVLGVEYEIQDFKTFSKKKKCQKKNSNNRKSYPSFSN